MYVCDVFNLTFSDLDLCHLAFFSSRLLAQLDETENAFEQFWSKHQLKLEQCLQLRHFEQDFREVGPDTSGVGHGFGPSF